MKLVERPSVQYWWERIRSLSAYFVIIGILLAVFWIVKLFTKPERASSTTTIGDVKRGGIANITNINNPVQDDHGLYIALTSEQATVGVFKKMTPNFRLSLGAGETYQGDAVVEVRAEVSF